MFVVYYDFFPYFWFTPFVNAGVGMTQNNLKIKDRVTGANLQSSKDDEFTWSVGGGISLKLTNRWNDDFGYRYYDMGKLAVLNGKKTDVKDQEVYAGLRYVFN
jgi:opacity protein-like surface antigen